MREEIKKDLIGWLWLIVLVVSVMYCVSAASRENEARIDRMPTCYLENDDIHTKTKDGKDVLVRKYVSCEKDLIIDIR